MLGGCSTVNTIPEVLELIERILKNWDEFDGCLGR